MQILNRVYKKVSVQFTHKTQYYVPNSGILVSRKTIEGKTSQSKTNNSPKKSEAQEFYLMEKLLLKYSPLQNFTGPKNIIKDILKKTVLPNVVVR